MKVGLKSFPIYVFVPPAAALMATAMGMITGATTGVVVGLCGQFVLSRLAEDSILLAATIGGIIGLIPIEVICRVAANILRGDIGILVDLNIDPSSRRFAGTSYGAAGGTLACLSIIYIRQAINQPLGFSWIGLGLWVGLSAAVGFVFSGQVSRQIRSPFSNMLGGWSWGGCFLGGIALPTHFSTADCAIVGATIGGVFGGMLGGALGGIVRIAWRP